MKTYIFFKLLNKKIKQYEKAASNPFDYTPKTKTVIIWIEDEINDNF